MAASPPLKDVTPHESPVYIKLTIRLLLLVLIITIMVAGRTLFIPLIIAVFFTFLLLPVSKKLEHFHFPRGLAIICSLLLAFVVFGCLIYFVYSQVILFKDDIPELKNSIIEKNHAMQAFFSKKFQVEEAEVSQWMNQKIAEGFNSGGHFVVDLFTATGSFLTNIALIPIFIFCLTYYREKLLAFILLVWKDPASEKAIISRVSSLSYKYLKGLLLDILILSTLSTIGFLLIGLEHAVLFGMLAGFLNIIPYIGVLIGGTLPVLMALMTHDNMGYAAGVLGICIFVQFLDNNFITPYVVGGSVRINPLAAIVALITGGLIWGIPGIILSVPLSGVVKVFCDHVDSLKPYGYLLGDEMKFGEKESTSAELKLKRKIQRKKKH